MERTSEHLASWLSLRAALPPTMPDNRPVTVLDRNRTIGADGLWAVHTLDTSAIVVCPEWYETITEMVQKLTLEELFSVFGAYELSRITLRDGIGIWGPSWYYAATEAAFTGVDCDEVRRLSPNEYGLIDPELFWHSIPEGESVMFGVIEDGRLLALSRADAHTSRLWEIGLDVHPDAKGRGLGRKVFSAAAGFIFAQGADVLARTAPWNVPSSRLQRSLGLTLQAQDLGCLPAPFRVPPQPLGAPLPTAEMENYYPDWAISTCNTAESRP